MVWCPVSGRATIGVMSVLLNPGQTLGGTPAVQTEGAHRLFHADPPDVGFVSGVAHKRCLGNPSRRVGSCVARDRHHNQKSRRYFDHAYRAEECGSLVAGVWPFAQRRLVCGSRIK